MAIAYLVGQKSKAKEWELLWENASPTSSFAAQMVALALSGYTRIKIEYTPSTSSTHSGVWMVELPVGTDTTLNGCYYYFVERSVTISAEGVNFGDGRRYEGTYGSSTLTNYTSACCPLKIWGMK